MDLLGVLPARAGMSPGVCRAPITRARAPRASGDEPAVTDFNADPTGCSPRERG